MSDIEVHIDLDEARGSYPEINGAQAWLAPSSMTRSSERSHYNELMEVLVCAVLRGSIEPCRNLLS